MVLLLYKFTIISFFLIILENIWQRTAAAEIDQNDTDGEQFIEKVVNGEKTAFERPEYLLFTAPYKICEGECSNKEDNFAMEFPIYIGKKGLAKYTDFYRRDHQKVYSGSPNAPLRKRPTKKLFTLCPTSTTTTSTEKTEPSTEDDNLTATMQNTDNTITEESPTTNGSTIDEKENQVTESDHDTKTDIETLTQTEIPSTSSFEIESVTQINNDTESETTQTTIKFDIETSQTQPTEIETEPQKESSTNAELTIEMYQNGTQSENFNDNGETHVYPSKADEKQTEVESNTLGERTSDDNDIQENTQTAEDTEMTGEQKRGDESIYAKESTQMDENIEIPGGKQFENEPINSKENTQLEESTVFSESILQHENESINSKENTQTEENIEFSAEAQYGNEPKKIKENTKADKLTENPQYGDEAINSKENIQTKENTEISGGIEHADNSRNLQNNPELNVQYNNLLYYPTNNSRDHRKLKFKIDKTSHTDRGAYNKILLFRPMLTAVTNAMGEMCPFYVCSKKVKAKKLELTTETRDQSDRDVTDKDIKFNQKYSYARRGWQNEIEKNFKFEDQRDITAARSKVQLNKREDQINESEEFPPYSDNNDENKNTKDLQVRSNAEDEFESYSDNTN